MSGFTVVTWNILADAYVKPGRYEDSPPGALEPETRRQGLLTALAGFDADLICLQEVEPHVFDRIAGHLRPHGWDWRYCAKGRGKPDGCATGFRPTRLELVAELRFEYPDGGERSDSGHVAHLLRFGLDGRRFTCANTHLKWSRRRGDDPHLGRRQLSLLLGRLDAADDRILCGDFNLSPDDPAFDQVTAAGLASGLPPEPTANFNGGPRTLDYICCPVGWDVDPLPRRDVSATGGLPDLRDPSDHIPVGARLTVA
ncbi:MAG: endonuclease/exonuclease/phosphatase family protein [Pseudomonadota bacterium]